MFHKLHRTWTAWMFSKCNLILCTFCGNLGKPLIIFYSHNRIKPDGKQTQGGSTQFLWKHLRSKSGPFGNTVQFYLHNKSKAEARPEQFFFKNVVGVRGLNGMRHIDICKDLYRFHEPNCDGPLNWWWNCCIFLWIAVAWEWFKYTQSVQCCVNNNIIWFYYYYL